MSNKVKWTEEQISFVKNNFGKMTYKKMESLLGIKKDSIFLKCKKLGLTKYNKWTEEEVCLLTNNLDKSIDDICCLLSNRGKDEIYNKLAQLKIKIKNPLKPNWTCEENDLLIKITNEHYSYSEVQQFFPNRTIGAIQERVLKLNLKLKVKEYIPVKYREGYGSKKSKVSNYKLKYGIILDKNLVLDTYDIIQWWKWTFYKTPNGKQLKCIPLEFHTEDKLLKLMRYVIENEIGYKTREDCLQLDIKTFKKYRLDFNTIFSGHIFDYINIIFPKYKIKPYELKNVPLKYWQNINNCDEYMEYVLFNDFNVQEMENIKIELPHLFTFANIRSLGYGKLACCITENKQYSSFYEWLNKLHPEWNLKPEDFKEYITDDGQKLNSSEELIVYNMFKKDLELNINPIGLKKTAKYRFYNDIFDEHYIPDFILRYNNQIYIIEYFGLYRENFGRSKILETYYNKTLRKVNFFSKLKEYNFIPIYQYEIKDLEVLKENILKILKEAS